MASIQTSIQLQDRITAPLQNIMNALNMTVTAFSEVNNASENAINVSAIQHEIAMANSSLNELGKELRQEEEQSKRTSTAFDGLGGSILGLGAALLSSMAISSSISNAIEYASDLTEVQNVVDVTFGNSSRQIDNWAKTTLNAYGLSELSAKRYAGTMGAMLKSSGLAGRSVDEMATRITELAGDMASFYNLNSEEAFNKIRSGISGETEPLKQLGINMSVANLNAYALSEGLQKTYDQMSQAEQVQLRYNYLLKVTADAQGDFTRTSDSYANQVKLIQENWLAFTGSMATNVLPTFAILLQNVNKLIGYLSDLESRTGAVSAVLGGLATTITVLATAWGVHAAAQWVAVAANQALMTSLLANPLTWVAVGIGVLVGLFLKWANSVGGVKIAWLICVDAFLTTFGKIQIGINNFTWKFQEAWNKIIDGAGDMKVAVIQTLEDLINGAITRLNKFINLLNKIAGVNIEAVQEVSFSAEAYASNEAQKQARANALAEGMASTERLAQQYQAEHLGRLGKIQGMQMAKAFENSNANGGVLDNIASYTNQTANNTSKQIDVTEENLKYMRDIAEQEAINRFTTAEIRVDMTNNNTVNNTMDIDGMVEQLTNGVTEAMYMCAEGVY